MLRGSRGSKVEKMVCFALLLSSGKSGQCAAYGHLTDNVYKRLYCINH